MSLTFHSLSLKDVRSETPNAVSLSFEVPEQLKETFQYIQGQYLTLQFTIKGQKVRRAYSMCTSPLDNDLAVTVKRIKGGLVSNYINENLKPGDAVEVMPPQGKFFVKVDPEKARTYYLFGGGSGITPLMSILKTVLAKEPNSVVHLLYGNLNEDNIIFQNALDQVKASFGDRFVLEHILQKPKVDKPKGLGGLFKKGTISWTGKVGIPDMNTLNAFLDEHPAQHTEVEHFICGPGLMMDAVEAVLVSRKIDKKHIHIERFSSTVPGEKPKAGANSAPASMAAVTLDGKEITVPVPSNKSILEALQDANYDPPYSCASGVCSTCMAKLTAGSVEMDDSLGLEDEELDKGFILTCQAHPTTEKVVLTYDFANES